MTTIETVTYDSDTGVPQAFQIAAPQPSRLTNQEVGALGEEIAARYLRTRNYRLLARNWRDPGAIRGELDLICQWRQYLVVVEVKTRRSASHGHPSLAVDPKKLLHMRRLTGAYLRGLDQHPGAIRFDVIAILLGPFQELSCPATGVLAIAVSEFDHFEQVA